MQQRDRDILEHIIRYCDRIAGYLDKIENSKARFLEDQMCQDACCMCIAQIGELSGHLSDEYKSRHTQVQWYMIAGLRHRLVHNYDGTNWNIIAEVVFDELPVLAEQIRNLLER